MYRLTTLEETVRIPPDMFGEEKKDAVAKILRHTHEGLWDKDMGFKLIVTDIHEVGKGRVIPGDGASYHSAAFDIVTYLPMLHEVVEGEVAEVLEFGAFVRIGPVDGLVHVSQVTNDFISFDKKNKVLQAKETKRTLKEGDRVRARIVTVSLKKDNIKIGLTLRQPGLGKLEWIVEDRQKKEGKEEPKKQEKERKGPKKGEKE